MIPGMVMANTNNLENFFTKGFLSMIRCVVRELANSLTE